MGGHVFPLREVDLWQTVLLHFLEVVVAADHNFFAQKADSHRVRRQLKCLELGLLQRLEHEFTQRHAREQFNLSWVIKRWNEDPLSLESE